MNVYLDHLPAKIVLRCIIVRGFDFTVGHYIGLRWGLFGNFVLLKMVVISF